MDDQLSTTWILDDSRYLSTISKINKIFDIYYCRMQSYLKNSILSLRPCQSLVGLLHDILSPFARALKVLDLTVPLYGNSFALLAGLCEKLEAMAGHNMLEALSFEVRINGCRTEDLIGSTIQNVEKLLVKPGWSALRRVSFIIKFQSYVVWHQGTSQSRLRRYNLYPINISAVFQNSIPLLSTIRLALSNRCRVTQVQIGV